MMSSTTEMQIKKRTISFASRSNAFERNTRIRDEMIRVEFSEIMAGILVYSDGRRCMQYYENSRLEEADRIEIYYL